jgi:hypothetical protein
MASAEELRQFATARFLQVGIDTSPDEERAGLWDVYRLAPEEVSSNLIDPAMRSVGALIEREGWHTLGARLAYLNPPQSIKPDERIIIRKVLDSPEVAVWPRWFRNFATLLLDRESAKRLWADFPDVESETVAVFQAAMMVAEELRDPHISMLQSFLQSNSPLDDQPGMVDAKTVFAHFEHGPEQNPAFLRQPLAQSVAGLFKLIEVMASFDDLFADLGELQFMHSTEGFKQVFEIYPESTGRFAIARATANLVTWRFNLRDQRTVSRLAIVMDAFWDICETQLRQHLQPGVTWSSTGSYDALIAMLERWRDRADPEREVEGISLSQLNRSVHNAMKQEASWKA